MSSKSTESTDNSRAQHPFFLKTISPNYSDPDEIRTAITGQPSDIYILVFLPHSGYPYLVPVGFVHDLFPPSSVIINELN